MCGNYVHCPITQHDKTVLGSMVTIFFLIARPAQLSDNVKNKLIKYINLCKSIFFEIKIR